MAYATCRLALAGAGAQNDTRARRSPCVTEAPVKKSVDFMGTDD